MLEIKGGVHVQVYIGTDIPINTCLDQMGSVAKLFVNSEARVMHIIAFCLVV